MSASVTKSLSAANNPFVVLHPGSKVALAATSQFPAAGHVWSQQEIDALTLAYAVRRPLLLRGEAGSGKSQIARVAARAMGLDEPFVEVIHPRFEASDLLYRFDAMQRLSDAQAQNIDPSNRRYVREGKLWKALDPRGIAAVDQQPDPSAKATSERLPKAVLLIDEIDKADADVPNALLDVMGNRSFSVPPLNDHRVGGAHAVMPLIVITTNEERELPAAFVRRCVVLNLNPPKDDDALLAWLLERGKAHEHLRVGDEARNLAAKQVLADRKQAQQAGYPRVGLAEYVDLLTALHRLTAELPEQEIEARQLHWLGILSAYALVKHADLPQDRAPVAPLQGRGPSQMDTDSNDA